VATREDHPLQPTSPYAISKRTGEELMLIAGGAHGMEVVALRYLNVYGPRQALSNPYTGVAAIFATQLLGGRAPSIFEDGLQRRDFVHVSDVVRANLLAADAPRAPGRAVNVGTGASITILDLARRLAELLGRDVEPQVTQRFRAGDVRHCWADVSLARDLLGFAATADRDIELQRLAAWVLGQTPVDRTAAAHAELQVRGLIRPATPSARRRRWRDAVR
jgi:dTDP-L-rhamnose 4-epimerase